MSISPIITFKAGRCELEGSKVKPLQTPGYIYLYSEDDLIHFCWRPRSAPLENAPIDLMMVPTDGSFTAYHPTSAINPSNNNNKPTNGRIYVLKFSSSSQRYLFWLQSRSQHPQAEPSWFSSRDLKLGEIVNNLLQGEEVDVQQAIAELPSDGPQDGDDDDDATMEDVEGTNHDSEHHRGGSGGAGPDATGGDIREEGEGAREGGADGGRAASDNPDANTIIQNFIRSMGGAQATQPAQREKVFTTLQDLLPPSATIPWIDSASEGIVDQLLQYLPPALTTLAQEADDGAELNTDHASAEASRQALSLFQKKDILRRVLRSPQFIQSLASLTFALRDGGLPSISEALDIPVRNGGYMRRGGVPLGAGEAIEAFLDGVKDAVKEKRDDKDRMDTQE